MHFSTLVVSAFAVLAAATPVPDPLEAFKRAGPAAGQVITKCSSPNMLALAFDDGPYQYTQKLVDTLNAGGAKGTFFVTGTLYGQTTMYLLRMTVTYSQIIYRLHLQPEDGAHERLQRGPPNRVA